MFEHDHVRTLLGVKIDIDIVQRIKTNGFSFSEIDYLSLICSDTNGERDIN